MPQKPKFTLLLSLLTYLSMHAQHAGNLDTTFGTDGKTVLPVGAVNAFGRAMAIQPDGKILVACVASNGTDTDFALTRLTQEGIPDQSLDGDGIIMTDFDGRSDIAEAMALDELNRIMVAGSVDSGDGFGFGVARYLEDGTLDENFGDHGLVTRMAGLTGFCKAVAVQSNHKIILGGYAFNEGTQTNEFVLMRFNPDGVPDSTFGQDGIVKTNMGIGSGVANAMFVQPDDKIILAGQVLNGTTFRWEIGIVRYQPDGSKDDTWGDGGIVLTGSMDADFTIKAIAMQADKKMVVGGYFGTAPSNNLFTIARYLTDGELDTTFGNNGIVLGSYGNQDNQVNTIVVQPDGQILIAGTSLLGNRDLFAIARLDASGNFDPDFGDQGVVRPVIDQNDGIHSMALQDDGKLVVAGESFNGQWFSMAAARVETELTTSVDNPVQNIFETALYPNPVVEEFTFTYKLGRTAPLRMVMTDINGQTLQVLANYAAQYPGTYTERFKVPRHLAGGTYFLSVSSGQYTTAYKLIIP